MNTKAVERQISQKIGVAEHLLDKIKAGVNNYQNWEYPYCATAELSHIISELKDIKRFVYGEEE